MKSGVEGKLTGLLLSHYTQWTMKKLTSVGGGRAGERKEGLRKWYAWTRQTLYIQQRLYGRINSLCVGLQFDGTRRGPGDRIGPPADHRSDNSPAWIRQPGAGVDIEGSIT